MTSLPSRSIRSESLLPLLFLAVFTVPLLISAGCADKHIGRRCETGVEPGDPDTVSVSTQALECPSRICLLPAPRQQMSPLKATCTDYCSNDDDCADAELTTNTADGRCKTGFACRYAIGNLQNSPIKCKKLCVCKDASVSADKPPSCP